MELNSNTSVGDIVKENFRTAQIFDKHNIDFCCGGNISLEKACKNSEVNMNDILPELESLVAMNDPDSKYINSLEPDELCDYIEKRHHRYVDDNIPFLQQKLQKLCDVHGNNHPELFKVKELFDESAGNLSLHMKKEELILFPYIREMVKFKKESLKLSEEFEKANETIELMEDEHRAEGERFKKIYMLTSSYTCPPDGCNTYRVTYQTFNEFEQDLHRHIHIENNILFVKALIMEKELTRKK